MIRPLRAGQFAADISVGLVLLGVAFFGGFVAPTAVDVIVFVGLAGALTVRRLSPAGALIISWAIVATEIIGRGQIPSFADLALLGVLHSSAAYGSRRVMKWGFVSAIVGAITATLFISVVPLIAKYGLWVRLPSAGNPPDGPDIARTVLTVFFGTLAALGFSWTLGLLSRTRLLAIGSRDAHQLAELEVVVEQERNRIARDMHDVVAHSLAVVIAQADGARYVHASDPKAVEVALLAISATAREALGDVRALLAQLRHSEDEGPQPSFSDIDRLLKQLRDSGLAIERKQHGASRSLPPGQQMAIYRIVQEALTNVLRHGDPRNEVSVDFIWSTECLEVVISSALGVDVPALVTSGDTPSGHGLAGMRERAVLAGGTLIAEPKDGRFIVTTVLPHVAERILR